MELNGSAACLIDLHIVKIYDDVSGHMKRRKKIRIQYLLSQLHITFLNHATHCHVRWLPKNDRHLTY